MKGLLSGALVIMTASYIQTVSAGAVFTGLGDLPGGDYESSATAVSADGSVIVGAGDSDLSASNLSWGGTEAFRWTADGGMMGLGDLPYGYFDSGATGTSADGSVVIGYGWTSNHQEAFRWTADEGMVGLGSLPSSLYYRDSRAFGVSDNGSVVVGSSVSGTNSSEAFRWTADGGMVGLGILADGYSSSQANGISGDGSIIVGHSSNDTGAVQAFRWTADDEMVGLGDLLGGGNDSTAIAVSGDGSVIVGWSDSNRGYEAFRWTADDGMMGLGSLSSFSYASDVSADGSVIVGTSLGAQQEAFIWNATDGMRSLQTVLTADHGVDLTGWTLTAATGISADGSVIIGNGINPDGLNEAWMVKIGNVEPPPPVHSNILFLDFDESTVTWDPLRLLGQPTTFTKPAFDPKFTTDFGSREAMIQHITDIVREHFSRFPVTVVTEMPDAATTVTRIAVGGTGDLIGKPPDIEGFAPRRSKAMMAGLVDIGNNSTGLAFQAYGVYDLGLATNLADTIAHEAAHMFGLVHIRETDDDHFLMESESNFNDGRSRMFSTSPQQLAGYLGQIPFPGPLDIPVYSQNDSYRLMVNLGGIPDASYGEPGNGDTLREIISGVTIFLPRTRSIFDASLFLSRDIPDIAPSLVYFAEEFVGTELAIRIEDLLLSGDRLLFLGASAPNGRPDIFGLSTSEGFDPANLSEAMLREFGLSLADLIAGMSINLYSYESGEPELIGYLRFQVMSVAVAEPSVFALFGLGLAGLGAVRRKKLAA